MIMDEKNQSPEVEETVEESPVEETTTEETIDWEAKAKELEAKANEAEGKYRRTKTKLDKIKEATNDKPKEEINNQTPDEPDYAKLAYLKTAGVEHPDDMKYVTEEANRLKMSLTDVLGMKHVQTQLKDNSDVRESEAGMPKGRGKAGGTLKDTVDYHLANGTTPDDQELAEKVIDARIAQSDSKKMFDDDLFIGQK